MTVDTSRVIEVEGSSVKMLALVGAGVIMTAASAAIAFRLLPGLSAGGFHELLGYFGLVFFALGTAVALWRLITARGPVVTITPQGIRDTRIAPELVPWSAIRGISTWELAGNQVMVLAVDPAAEARLTLSTVARWTRSANRALGADGLCVSAQGLKIDYQTLLATSMDYLRTARPSG